MKHRTITSTGSAMKRPGSHEFRAAHLSSSSVGANIDPVIGIDHFEMRAPKFAPHPHAGFSAVTLLFEDSEGDFINRDSLGDSIVAHPGSLIWTVAGSGVIHEEYPRVRGQLAHGLQVFVNLPASEKLLAPRLLFVDGPDVPVVARDGVRVRVMVGDVGDARAAIVPPGDVTLLDVTVDPGATFEHVLGAEKSVLVYVIRGSVTVGEGPGRLDVQQAASFAPGEGALALRATGDGAHVVVFGARPLAEPVVSHGPFVMNDERQIEAAIDRYRAGRMGSLVSTADAT